MDKINPLRLYLIRKGMTIKDLADEIDFSQQHLSAYLRGVYRISPKCARYIEEVTEGKVKAKQLLSYNSPKPSEIKKRSIAKKH